MYKRVEFGENFSADVSFINNMAKECNLKPTDIIKTCLSNLPVKSRIDICKQFEQILIEQRLKEVYGYSFVTFEELPTPVQSEYEDTPHLWFGMYPLSPCSIALTVNVVSIETIIDRLSKLPDAGKYYKELILDGHTLDYWLLDRELGLYIQSEKRPTHAPIPV